VLVSLGLDDAEASSGIRLSLGVTSADEDVDRALDRVPFAIERLRTDDVRVLVAMSGGVDSSVAAASLVEALALPPSWERP